MGLKNTEQLCQMLKERLTQYNYIEYNQGIVNEVDYISIIATKRKFTTRYICTITDYSENEADLLKVNRYLNKIRKSLIRQYAKFPYYKELGTYSIVFCESNIYDFVSENIEKLVDKSGLHMNVMLGTVFINKDSFKFTHKSAWGLYYSGQHFKSMLEVVGAWCDKQIET